MCAVNWIANSSERLSAPGDPVLTQSEINENVLKLYKSVFLCVIIDDCESSCRMFT